MISLTYSMVLHKCSIGPSLTMLQLSLHREVYQLKAATSGHFKDKIILNDICTIVWRYSVCYFLDSFGFPTRIEK